MVTTVERHKAMGSRLQASMKVCRSGSPGGKSVGFGLCNLSHEFLCFLNAAHVQSQGLI